MSVSGRVEIYGKEIGVAGRFGEAVAMNDADAKLCVEPMGQFCRQRARAADDMPKRRQIVTGNGLAGLAQKRQYRRNDTDPGAALVCKRLPERSGMEPAMENDTSPERERRDKRHDRAVDVMNGQDAHRAVTGGKPMP